MNTVGVNGRTVVHKGSAGFSVAPNDVCLTPGEGFASGFDPVPYVNLGLSAHAVDEAGTVYAEGHRVMNAKSAFAFTTGDEPGVLGGVISHTWMGMASFANFSCDVYIEGEPTPRAFDPMMQNHGSPYNAYGPALIQAVLALSAWEIVCKVLCSCHRAKQKMNCFKPLLAEPRWGLGPMGGGTVWDPYFPGIWIEPSYGRRAGYISAWDHSRFQTDENGRPLPLPAPEWEPVPGSSRPDVVITIDPHKPPVPGNIREIYEVKFPPDQWRPGQLERYKGISKARVREVSPEKCGCEDKKKRKKKRARSRAPAKEPKKVPAPQLNPFQRLSELPIEQQILIGLGIGIAGGLLGPILVPVPI